MKIFWLNDALTIQAENTKERETLTGLLEILPSSSFRPDLADSETGLLSADHSKSD